MNFKSLQLIFVVLFLIAISLFGTYCIFFKKTGEKIAEIYQNGELIYRINLDKTNDAYTIEIKGHGGEINVIEVEKGRIRMKESNCPDGTCMRIGWVSDRFLPVVCLPHNVVIKIEGEKNAEEFDDKAY